MEGYIRDDLATANPDSVNPVDLLDWQDSRNQLLETTEGRALVDEWQSMAGFKTHLERVQTQARGIVNAVSEDRRAMRVFMQRFDDSMTEAARYAVYAEIADGPPSFVNPVDEDGLKKFGANQVGRELIDEWGPWAAEKVAAAWFRANRLLARMDDADALDFLDWFDDLKPNEAKTIIKSFVGD
ncbi:hypothetical protein BSQ44_24020 [Aquibium oceanicum]|uniref:Uncharacterized protein n=1 Tax=Aquibium oceanicum TaxID=1670800 RepID=A0A1L3SXI6_9HYPH|nr:hypothetical protein BSQ44_24020 [Aquibium oceanicum]